MNKNSKRMIGPGIRQPAATSAEHIASSGVADVSVHFSDASAVVPRAAKHATSHDASLSGVRPRSEHRSKAAEVSGRVVENWQRVERLLRERVARSLSLLDVPSRDEMQTLTRRIDQLQRDVQIKQRALNRDLIERKAEIEQCATELAQTRSSLEQAHALATLAAIVPALAHDISTPAGNSNLAVSTLQARLHTFRTKVGKGELRKSELDYFLKQLDEGLNIITTAGARVGELVESLKHVSIDQASGRRRSFEFDDLVTEVITTLAPSLRKTSLQIERNIGAGLKMDSYPGALGQVLINLTQNAIQHGFKGREPGTIRIEAEALGDNWIQVRFSDDGSGMDESALGKIFTPFFTTRLDEGGSGLGLAYSKRLLETTLGGTISVSSQPGSGTVFVIELPCDAPHAK